MNSQQTQGATSFNSVRGARALSAAMGCVMGLGMMFAVVHGMVAQSGGHSLGDFVASHLAAEQPVFASGAEEQTVG